MVRGVRLQPVVRGVRLEPDLCAALAIAVLAFALYLATLLPSFDFGDTGSLQTTVGSSLITPRDGYPLYFALGNFARWVARAEPAHTLNVVSAIEGALACGVVVLAGAELAGALLPAIGAALLFAASYTFWSQAIIAEVYALHMLFVAATLWLLLRWERRPTLLRLAAFFAVYALGFGNHLSMILLAPGYALFLLTAAPRGWRSMLSPRVVALALAIAGAGALQYAWNFRALWVSPSPPHGLVDALQTFWFDVTKSDWRETLVMHVPRSMLGDHGLMYLFDLRQQFGWTGPLLATLGLVQLFGIDWHRGLLMLTLYVTNLLFAYSYNVGDAHVFYLPSHLCIALLVAPGIVRGTGALSSFCVRCGFTYPETGKGSRPPFVALASALLIVYGGARVYRDYPALDRSNDRRPTDVLATLTSGLDDRHAILLADLDWELENGLAYFSKEVQPNIAFARMPDVLLSAPGLVRNNQEIGRDVVLTERARREMTRAYGPLLSIEPDPQGHVTSIADLARGLPAGTRYALCVLRPLRAFTLDVQDLGLALRTLSGGALGSMPEGDFAVVAGIVGQSPPFAVGSSDPFRRQIDLGGVPVDIRMESWLPADTIRRMGFGHVIAARRHTLIVERGVSFTAFDDSGRAIRTGYAANIFAPQARYVIR